MTTQTTAARRPARKTTKTEQPASNSESNATTLDLVAFRKWLSESWLPNLSEKDRKAFDALSLEKRRETSLAAYREFLARPKEEAKAPREPAGERTESIGIQVMDGGREIITEIEELPPSTNKGVPSPDSPRGKVLARKRVDAEFLNGRVVFIKPDYQRGGS